MKFATYFSKQARKPAGIFGRFFMSRVFDRGNSELNDLMYETLSIGEHQHVLEIGFGTGALIKRISQNIETGIVEGIDFSETMVSMAQRKNRDAINAGRVIINSGDFDEVKYDDDCFDVIFSVNTIYFWKHPDKTVSKIGRLLKPGGRILIGFHSKREMGKMPLLTDVFRYYTDKDVVELLSRQNCFKDIDVVSKEGKQMPSYCAVGTKY